MTSKPRYRQLADKLRRRIRSGKLKPGDLLPTELELCKVHNISRHTAREALRLLTEDGFIERRRGLGSIVTQVTAPSFSQSIGDFSSLLQYARDTRLRLDSRKRGDKDYIEFLGLTGSYTVFKGVRLGEEDRPLASTSIVVRSELAPTLSVARTLEGSFTEWIEDTHQVPIAAVSQRIEAIAATKESATALDVKSGSPLLRTVRRYRGAGDEILVLSESLHPAGRFAYEMRLTRTP
ncbi:MAG: GntR family transcriptional regulator [Pseudomonadota bacterium]